jgi:hypothetical protein
MRALPGTLWGTTPKRTKGATPKMATIQKERILQFRGENLYDRDGDKIGKIEEIYLDAETDQPEWALVHTGLFGTKRTFVPVHEAIEREGNLSVPFEKSTVKDAPGVEANGQLSQREEAELYRHYGRDYTEMRADTAGTGTRDDLAAGTTGERARLRRYETGSTTEPGDRDRERL